jgi:nicotinamide-nucleotide amidase
MAKNTIPLLAKQLGDLLMQRHLRCAVAESCTGGGLSAAMTDIPGSSQWFDRGFVTYSNQAKEELLGVSADVIQTHGAVSEAVVSEMALGAIANSAAEISVSISGIAGPGGGSMDKPVGTVWIGFAGADQPIQAHCYVFPGDRQAIRQQAVEKALQGLIQCIKSMG